MASRISGIDARAEGGNRDFGGRAKDTVASDLHASHEPVGALMSILDRSPDEPQCHEREAKSPPRTLAWLPVLLIAATVFAAAQACATERLRIAAQKTGTLAWELEVVRAHGLDLQADLAIDDDRARQHRGRQDRAERRLGRPDRLRLAVGRARACAGRQSGVLSVFDARLAPSWSRRIRRSKSRRSERQKAWRCRRAARQELAAAPSLGAAIRNRPQIRGVDRLRRASAACAKGVARRD